MSHASDKDYRVFGLDALRALAIVLVLVAHTWPSKKGIQYASAFAILGVELFFVLSGFLIGGILLRLAEEGNLRRWSDLFGFWRRRWFRTLPNYYLFLLLHLAWRSWVLGFPDVINTNWKYFFFLQNFNHQPSLFFPETWSLAVEEWFYLLFALALWIALRWTRKPWHAYITVVALFLLIPNVLREWQAFDPSLPQNAVERREVWDSGLRKTAILRLDVVMYGVAAALLAARRPTTWMRLHKLWPVGALLIVGAASCIAFHWPLDRAKSSHGLALFPVIALGFTLWLPSFSSWRAGGGVASALISWIARLSYSIYLCHGLILIGLERWFGRRSEWPLPPNTVQWTVAVWMLSFSVAWCVYRWFERPMTEVRERFGSQRPRPSPQQDLRPTALP